MKVLLVALSYSLFAAVLRSDSAVPFLQQQGPSPTSESGQKIRLLNVILFESFMTPSVKEGSSFDKYDWPNSDFPRIYSQLISLSRPLDITVPPDFEFPERTMFVDIYTFALDDARVSQKKDFSRRNDMTLLRYKIAVVLRSDDRYEITLEGHHEDFKFRNVNVEAPNNRTELIRIRHSANRTLYFALTPIQLANELEPGIVRPKSIARPDPPYPSQLHASKWAGNIRILCTVSSTGSIDPQDYVLLICPHTLFARNSIDVVLSRWKFMPATSSGIPVDFRMVIDVPFVEFNPKLKLQFPRLLYGEAASIPQPESDSLLK